MDFFTFVFWNKFLFVCFVWGFGYWFWFVVGGGVVCWFWFWFCEGDRHYCDSCTDWVQLHDKLPLCPSVFQALVGKKAFCHWKCIKPQGKTNKQINKQNLHDKTWHLMKVSLRITFEITLHHYLKRFSCWDVRFHTAIISGISFACGRFCVDKVKLRRPASITAQEKWMQEGF